MSAGKWNLTFAEVCFMLVHELILKQLEIIIIIHDANTLK